MKSFSCGFRMGILKNIVSERDEDVKWSISQGRKTSFFLVRIQQLLDRLLSIWFYKVSQINYKLGVKRMAKSDTPKLNRSGVATRERLVSIARDLFVANGFTGTSMTQIAAKADVNHSLLFHHFGSKLNLWLDVKDLIIEEGKRVSIILPSTDQPLESFLREIIYSAIAFFKNNPDIVRMMNWQRLEKTTSQESSFNLAHESEGWVNAAKHYIQVGEIDSSVKPEFAMSMVLAIATSIATDPNTFVQTGSDIDEYVEFCVQRIKKAMS